MNSYNIYLKSVLIMSLEAFCPEQIIRNSLFVWQNRRGFPLLVSGVPPDAFSKTGQLWGRFDIY